MNGPLSERVKRLNRYYINILIILTAFIALSLGWNIYNESEHRKDAALEHAKNSFVKDLMFREWVASHGGVYVPPTERTPPNPYLAHIKDRDLITTTGKRLTLMNPAYTLRQLMNEYEGMYGAKGHITSLKLFNPDNKASAWETKALKLFDRGEQDALYEFLTKDGKEYIYYMKALVTKASCLRCHAYQGYKVGDTRGGVSIIIPMKKYDDDMYDAVSKIIAVHLIFYIIAVIGLFYTYKRVKIALIEQDRLEEENQRKEEIMIAQSRHAAMGEMISMIAHQWRQPLSIIAMGANNMLADIDLEELSEAAFQEQSYSILKQTQYLSKTIDDFRDFFRPDKEVEAVRLEDVMSDAQKIIGKSLENSAITLDIRREESQRVRTYSRELLQVYINLLKNAKEALVEYGKKERHIDVTIKSDDANANAITTICDNGGGIDEAIIDKIFDPYFSTKDEKSGTGLGLYMSKIIIEKHLYGTITVENSKEGACFTVTLPIDRIDDA